MTIHTVARQDVVTIEPATPVSDIADLMARERVGSAIVVDAGQPVGIVTDRDLAIDVLGVGADPTETTAMDVMQDVLVTATADMGVFEAINEMAREGVRRLPLTSDGELVGIVTLDDLVVLLAGELVNLASVIDAESPPRATP